MKYVNAVYAHRTSVALPAGNVRSVIRLYLFAGVGDGEARIETREQD